MADPLSNNTPIGKWIEKWNEIVFFQPDDELSAKTLSETIFPNVTVNINHDIYDINGLVGGVQMVRSTFFTTLISNEELVEWHAPDGVDGAAVHKTVFSSKDKKSGKVVTKTSLVTTFVKAVDGKRKVAELVEVEEIESE